MKNIYKQYVLFFVGFIVVLLLVLFRPSVWQDRIDKYLNNQLYKSGWSLNNSVFSGHLFTKISSSDVLLKSSKGTLIVFPRIEARIKILPLILGKIKLNELSVSKAQITPSLKLNENPSNRAVLGIKQIPIDIEKLNIDGNVILPSEDSTRSYSFFIDGGIVNAKENLVIDLNELSIISNESLTNLSVKGWKGSISDEKNSN